ncbi:hypothetical protein SEA_MARCIE_12 [Microbacterium phage Marcie]|nr:hypothetical protein SEA_MARCIE_12 [Microbacterium phage Marcie]
MAEPTDPLEGLDFAPRCESTTLTHIRCQVPAEVAFRSSCGCATIVCLTHAAEMTEPTAVFYCREHQTRVTVSGPARLNGA